MRARLSRAFARRNPMPPDLVGRNRRPPAWWSDAGFGIFIHWGLYSVPGFAPTGVEINDVIGAGGPHPLAESPYAEWYQNSLRFPGSSTQRHHAATHPGRSYEDFRTDFEAGLDNWDPEAWARAFADAGAGYVVMVTKHHDGYCLWPSEVPNPHRPGFHSSRDLVGELAAAVRSAGMRFGVYYSGGYDWTFNDHPIGRPVDSLLAIPFGDYADYAAAHVAELAERYRPSILWNDICWPAGRAHLYEVLSGYFDAVPDGVVNDRFLPAIDIRRLARLAPVGRAFDAIARRQIAKGGLVPPKVPFSQFRTPEYTEVGSGFGQAWEMCRGVDASFGYNAASTEESMVSRDELLSSMRRVRGAGGNYLLNVGPRGVDAAIPDEQLLRLQWLAEARAADGGVSSETGSPAPNDTTGSDR